MLGLVAFVLLVWMSFRFLARQKTTLGKAVVTAFVIWSVMTMMHSAMRLVAPSLVFGLAASLMLAETARGRLQPARPPGPRGPGRGHER